MNNQIGCGFQVTEKTYVGREEAFEINMERGHIKLPRIGRQNVTVYPINLMKRDAILGKDETGYYLQEIYKTS